VRNGQIVQRASGGIKQSNVCVGWVTGRKPSWRWWYLSENSAETELLVRLEGWTEPFREEKGSCKDLVGA
jgi:hypothetical protein